MKCDLVCSVCKKRFEVQVVADSDRRLSVKVLNSEVETGNGDGDYHRKISFEVRLEGDFDSDDGTLAYGSPHCSPACAHAAFSAWLAKVTKKGKAKGKKARKR